MKKYNITVNGTTYEVEVEEIKNASDTSPAPAAPVQETKAAATKVAPASDESSQTAQAGTSAAPAKPASAGSAAPTAVSASAGGTASAGAAVPEGGTGVKAPVPGTVLDIRVEAGQQVAQGDILVILEAMKMENEIAAPAAGKVASIQAIKGTSVNAGDILITLE